MNISIKNLDLELSLILARIYKYLKIKSGISTDILNTSFSKLDMTLYPYLALLAAQGSKGITKKNRTLAVASQIIFMSTEIHNRIPESHNGHQFAKQIQLPILVGDLLYSRFYEILCTEDCIEYLECYLEYISQLNIKWVDYLQQKSTIEEISANWYGELASLVMELNAKASGFNNYLIKTSKKYGFAIGNLYGAYKLNLSIQEVNKSWNMVLEAINLMPPGETKNNFSLFAHDLYKTLFQDLIKEDVFLTSAVAEN